MHDGAQTVGVLFQFADKGQDPGFAGEVREQRDRPQVAQGLHAGAFTAVADDHRLTVFEQPFGAMQPDTLAGAGDEDRGKGGGHGRLAWRVWQNYTSDEPCKPMPSASVGDQRFCVEGSVGNDRTGVLFNQPASRRVDNGMKR
ncbi:hypothetical protein D3C75_1051700 [compost metagenome]